MLATDEVSDLDVQSVLPSKVPKGDQQKKKVLMISGLQDKVESDLTASDVEVGNRSQEDLHSHFVMDYVPEEKPEEPELSCTRKVKMVSENVKHKKKEIKMYENQEKE